MSTQRRKPTLKERYRKQNERLRSKTDSQGSRGRPSSPQPHRPSAGKSVGEQTGDPPNRSHLPQVLLEGNQAALERSNRGGSHGAPLTSEHAPSTSSMQAEPERSILPESMPSNANAFEDTSLALDCFTGNLVIGAKNSTIVQNFGDDSNWLESLSWRLNICLKADYCYYPGHQEQGLRRSGCTRGTRVPVIRGIIEWAWDISPSCQHIFWLSGQGGAGKTAIAYSITERLATIDPNAHPTTILGGSFFCSRYSPETRTASVVVPTIAYRLAEKSPAFRAALKDYGDFGKAHHGPLAQFEALIVMPWKQCLPQRALNNEPCFIISIDAIDELDPPGGTDFFQALIKIVKDHNLPGLKFFVTSRLEPTIVEQIESFDNKQVCRLEEMPIKETNADIERYLRANLDKSVVEEEAFFKQLVTDSNGLFIYAATVVDYLKGRSAAQQQDRLTRLLTQPSHGSSRLRGATAKLDHLYQHILQTSLVDARDQRDPAIRAGCLAVLHTFLCTNERTSTALAVELLNKATAATIPVAEADELVQRLHAVLYVQDGQVLWYHKSFPDFIFDRGRSEEFHCHQDERHRHLVNGCFGVMRQELRFNIADISTSYQLDRDNADLPNAVKKNVSVALSYACRSWSGHLVATPSGSSTSPLGETVGDFLQMKVLFWIETMNLLGCSGNCAAMLNGAENWVAQSEESPSLQGDLNDASAFAFHFSSHGAALSTPHLYISSLATFPRHSKLVSRWRERFSRIPGFINCRSTAGGGLALSMRAEDTVLAVAISSNSTWIAMGLRNGTIRTQGLTIGGERPLLKGHIEGVTSVAYSPDGKHIVSGSYDTSVRVWDVSTGQQLQSLEGHTTWVTSVAYSPDGKHIVSGSWDTSVRGWDVLRSEQPEISYLREKLGKVHTGWLVLPVNPSLYLMFVPLSENIPDPSNTLTIPSSLTAYLSLSEAALGNCWTECYSPHI